MVVVVVVVGGVVVVVVVVVIAAPVTRLPPILPGQTPDVAAKCRTDRE